MQTDSVVVVFSRVFAVGGHRDVLPRRAQGPDFGQLLTEVGDDEIGDALEALWGDAAVNTWNARRAAVPARPKRWRWNGKTAPSVTAHVETDPKPRSTDEVAEWAARRRRAAHWFLGSGWLLVCPAFPLLLLVVGVFRGVQAVENGVVACHNCCQARAQGQ